MRLIDADALMKKYGDTDDVVETRTKGEWEVYIATLEDFFNTVDSMPTIDAEPVLRCEHCIYNMRNTDGVAEDYCYKHVMDIDCDDYCSHGESTEEEEWHG